MSLAENPNQNKPRLSLGSMRLNSAKGCTMRLRRTGDPMLTRKSGPKPRFRASYLEQYAAIWRQFSCTQLARMIRSIERTLKPRRFPKQFFFLKLAYFANVAQLLKFDTTGLSPAVANY
jgi:hypothetical protein